MNEIITIAFAINGIWLAFNKEGMIFYKLGNYLETKLPDYLTMPLFRCATCMASLWTIFFMIPKISFDLLWMIPAVASISTIIFLITNNLSNE
jgi:hypothetical protein